MTYLSFRIQKDKNKTRFRVFYHYKSGTTEGHGTYCDLYEVSGQIVAMGVVAAEPKAIFRNLNAFVDHITAKHGIKPKIEA